MIAVGLKGSLARAEKRKQAREAKKIKKANKHKVESTVMNELEGKSTNISGEVEAGVGVESSSGCVPVVRCPSSISPANSSPATNNNHETSFLSEDSNAGTAPEELVASKSIPSSERPADYWAPTKISKWTAQQQKKYGTTNNLWAVSTSETDSDFAGKIETAAAGTKRKATESPERNEGDNANTKTKAGSKITKPNTTTKKVPNSWLQKVADPDADSDDDDSSISSKDSDDEDKVLVNPTTKHASYIHRSLLKSLIYKIKRY